MICGFSTNKLVLLYAKCHIAYLLYFVDKINTIFLTNFCNKFYYFLIKMYLCFIEYVKNKNNLKKSFENVDFYGIILIVYI